ncbi:MULTISPECIES: flavin reductase family protein [Thermomonospora]|uniref:Flavin reductase (DIM6/NTAB) family NADH-FMN oxidoreductase RutF n=1 Tax=Thermomonospora cellulosilytica TaxID=1411118 RepID=A0A7W3MXQ9_9ACTN|nr:MULTISPECIES: flavin reductase family protein [Thermomonospora]MBA9003821.1 flavin reductase (DIM6/NTAB) family NADH-FMN oxidoreductase RutF [Thermomonospora cellulosilytica]
MNDNALPPPVDTAEFRRVVGRFATGVTIVSTVADGVDHAMTVNAFTSVSLDPLLVLFCAEKVARFHDAVLRSGQWAVSVLPEGAQDLSTWFATRGRPLDDGRLGEHPFKRGPQTGAPILTEAVASLECRTHAVHEGGDHSIVVGEVLAVDTPDPGARPLLFFEGRYRGLA